jgi:hypothetical protein
MKKDNKYKFRKILSYLGGKLAGREKNTFEREAQKDPFLEDALEGLSMLTESELKEDIDFLNNRIQAKGEKRKPFLLYKLAAALALIVFISSLFVSLFYYTNQVTNESDIAVLETKSREEDKSAEEISSPVPQLSESSAKESKKVQDKPLPVTISKTTQPLADVESEVALEEIASVKQDNLRVEIPEKAEELAFAIRQAQAPLAAADRAFAPDAPEKYISGFVLSADDSLPIPGVSIVIKGSNTGVVTDFDGKFRLNISDIQDNTLIASFVGMKTLEIKPDSTKEMEVLLEPDLLALDEVVVTGYGTRKRSTVAGASQTISYDELIMDSDFRSARPVQGSREFTNYINSNTRFPENTDLKRAVVVLGFIVDSTGRPKNISVLRSPGAEFSNEAIRLLVEGPDWVPATLRDETIEVVSQIRIVLKK